jgi:hypothetical protein
LPVNQQGRLRLLCGEDLPEGWIGKNFACHQLAQQASGNYLLFTDADTVHQPAMAKAVIDCMQQINVQLLTAQPAHLMKSFGERLIVPLLNFTILTLLPVALILKRPEPSLATGNGQLLCFEHQAYEKIGGHAGVKDHILALFVLPLALILAAPFTGLSLTILRLAIIAYLLPVVMRMLLTLRFMHTQKGVMLLLCLLHPLSILMECLILLNAIRWHYRRAGNKLEGALLCIRQISLNPCG